MTDSERLTRQARKPAMADALLYGAKPTGDPHHDRMCAGKKGFATKSQAKAAAKRTIRNSPSSRKGMGQYECPYCALWHNGHSTEPRG